ncbi:DNA (cytosine-5-)-methyltransferase [Variovorax sp. RO1]|uniref:DNA cytosine methyltransferase n=1 Tax=Variovorax sp. RO1 TaxID=2066034 RepID=UPI000C717F22|nr:DNA cytosine methyltransferase [Variovorax sp. RO1]PLC06037.1 DNA (cytosine-5-)-methyltransferase [Variovorax sp. RO1]
MRAVELFTGAGGLAMGASLAGFKPLAVVEWDKWACDTVRENQARAYPLVADWPLTEGDVRAVDWSSIPTDIELVAGGPPCQPFSMGGKHRAFNDNRDMFPATVDIIRRLRPKCFIVENVKGLTRSSFANYFEYIKLQLEFPEVPSRKNEDWMDHLRRLQEERTSGTRHGKGLTYKLVTTLVNAANYGVPQRRERVFIVGFRHDQGVEWAFPKETHSYEALLYDQYVSGAYWDRHGVSKRSRPAVPPEMAARVRKLAAGPRPSLAPWRTVRDALVGLPDPQRSSGNYRDHNFQPGARSYPGHTGSPLDLPAKTLKAGNHGVPGGENMLVAQDGSVRYFTVRESARIQTFPDGYVFHGSWTETMRQLGNAVPVALGRVVAASVAEELMRAQMRLADRASADIRRKA